MPLLNIESVQQSQLQRDPFDFLVAPNFIDSDGLAQINADYPAIDTAANHDLDSLSYGPAFGRFVAEMRSRELAEVLAAKFDMDLVNLPTTLTVRKFCERTDGNIHTDHKSKVLTVLVYFNADWTATEGRLRMLRSGHDIEDYAAEVAPIGGTLLAFRRTGHSWHGHTRFVGERRMVQLNYLDQSAWSVASQRLSRFSTRFVKNVLGLR
ncbi:2OG-Fe(II) oxygenase [Porticoccus sp.]